jgi:hypothetical protein
MRCLALALLGGLVIMPAEAQERPRILPERDVDVTYAVRGTGHDEVQKISRLAYSVAARGFRIDEEQQPGFILMEPRDGTMRVVSDARKAVVALPRELTSGGLWDPAVRFTRLRTSTVAGIACTEWRIATPVAKHGALPTEPQEICLSADGVALSFHDAMESRIATVVTFAPLDANRFRVPAGYRAMTMAEAQRLEKREGAAPR